MPRRLLPVLLFGAVLLILAAVFLPWPAETWTAIAAWATVGAAVTAGGIAFGQLREAQRLRHEEAQPYVAVYMEGLDEVDRRFVDLVIKNFGNTAAFNVKVDFDPKPQRATEDEWADVAVPDLIPVLVPGQDWRTHWDFGPRRAGSNLPDRHTATVEFENSRDDSFSYEYVLDFSIYQSRMQVTKYGIHHAAKALQELQETIKSRQRP